MSGATAISPVAMGTALTARAPLPDLYEQARLVEALGYHSAWIPEIIGRDALVTTALLASRTERLVLATGVVPLSSRSPVLLAMGAAAVGEVAPERFMLGVGAGHDETANLWFGRERALRVADLGPKLDTLRAVLDPAAPKADVVRLRGVHHRAAPPILLGALGERSVAIGAEHADGVVLNWITVERAATLAARVRRTAEQQGKDPGELTVACYIPVCVTSQTDEARYQLARQIAAYAPLRAYRRSLERCGLGQYVTAMIDAGGAAENVPDTLIDALGFIGPVAQVREGISAYKEVGVSLPVIVPIPLVGDLAWPSIVETWSALC